MGIYYEKFELGLKTEPDHWLRFKKDAWSLRTKDPERRDHLKEIVKLSYQILTRKMAGQKLVVNNEASFQLHLAYILQAVGELYEFNASDLFVIDLESHIPLKSESVKSKSKKARVDIILSLGDEERFSTCAIELKIFKKINHREPNNRYDVFTDIFNLEIYKEKYIDLAYFILGTDHTHYVDQKNYSHDTKDFDFRDGRKYIGGTKLEYKTRTPYGNPIILRNNYQFKWNRISKSPVFSGELYFLKVEI